jgi:hypothetical protein
MGLCLAKAGSALLAPQVFYRLRRQQYASSTIPVSVYLPPFGVGLLALTAWYATFSQYAAWSWIVTGFLTVVSLLAMINLLRWSQHRIRLLDSIAEDQAAYRRQVDVGLLGIGTVFGILGFIVF